MFHSYSPCHPSFVRGQRALCATSSWQDRLSFLVQWFSCSHTSVLHPQKALPACWVKLCYDCTLVSPLRKWSLKASALHARFRNVSLVEDIYTGRCQPSFRAPVSHCTAWLCPLYWGRCQRGTPELQCPILPCSSHPLHGSQQWEARSHHTQRCLAIVSGAFFL